MQHGLKTTSYFIDLSTDKDTFNSLLKEKNPDLDTENLLKENKFLLSNSTSDIWFWDEDLVTYFFGDIMEQVF